MPGSTAGISSAESSFARSISASGTFGRPSSNRSNVFVRRIGEELFLGEREQLRVRQRRRQHGAHAQADDQRKWTHHDRLPSFLGFEAEV